MHLRQPWFTYGACGPFTKNKKIIQKYDGGFALMVYTFSDKKTSAMHTNKFAGGAVKNKNMWDQKLAVELHKPIIRKFEKQKVYFPFIDNIRGADLPNMQLINKFKKRICFLLCVIDIFSKYALYKMKKLNNTEPWIDICY